MRHRLMTSLADLERQPVAGVVVSPQAGYRRGQPNWGLADR